MQLEEILQTTPDRRDFLKMSTAFLLLGCESDRVTGTGPGNREDPPQPSPTNKQDPPGDYTGFSIPKYVAQEANLPTTHNAIRFTNGYGITEAMPVDETQTSVKGNFVIGLYENDQEQIITAHETENNFAPGVRFVSKRAAKKSLSGSTEIEVYSNLIENAGIAIKAIKGSMPEWNPDHVINLPGIIYKGDWSFNQVKNLTTVIAGISTVLAFIPGPQQPILASISAISKKSTAIIQSIDEVIDLINETTPLEINKDLKFSWYELNGLPNLPILIPTKAIDALKKNRFNITEYYPLQENNQWNYYSTSGNLKEYSIGTKNIKGKEVIVLENSKREQEFYGYLNGKLKLMGAYSPSTGEFYLEPGIVIGTNSLKIGDEYSTTSNIIFPNLPYIKGTITGTLEFKGLEHVSVPAGEFGDCLKARETGNINIINTSTNQRNIGYEAVNHWFAKNIGHTKIEIVAGDLPSGMYKLRNAVINDMSIPKPASAEYFSFGMIKTIETTLKKII